MLKNVPVAVSYTHLDVYKRQLTYSRKKTGQRLTILWEELMQEIVDKYKDNTSEYLLPILRYCDINDRKQYKLLSLIHI